uniref:Proteinral transcriptional corepressor trfa n=1 Tax=Corethrella appendiculata TaxID=1370023 RepID=U5ESX1_9DIPT
MAENPSDTDCSIDDVPADFFDQFDDTGVRIIDEWTDDLEEHQSTFMQLKQNQVDKFNEAWGILPNKDQSNNDTNKTTGTSSKSTSYDQSKNLITSTESSRTQTFNDNENFVDEIETEENDVSSPTELPITTKSVSREMEKNRDRNNSKSINLNDIPLDAIDLREILNATRENSKLNSSRDNDSLNLFHDSSRRVEREAYRNTRYRDNRVSPPRQRSPRNKRSRSPIRRRRSRSGERRRSRSRERPRRSRSRSRDRDRKSREDKPARRKKTFFEEMSEQFPDLQNQQPFNNMMMSQNQMMPPNQMMLPNQMMIPNQIMTPNQIIPPNQIMPPNQMMPFQNYQPNFSMTDGMNGNPMVNPINPTQCSMNNMMHPMNNMMNPMNPTMNPPNPNENLVLNPVSLKRKNTEDPRLTSKKPNVDFNQISSELFMQNKINLSDYLSTKVSANAGASKKQKSAVISKIREAVSVIENLETQNYASKFLYVTPTFSSEIIRGTGRSPLITSKENVMFDFTRKLKDTNCIPLNNVNSKLKQLVCALGLDEGIISNKIEKRKAEEADVANKTEKVVQIAKCSDKAKRIIDIGVQTEDFKCNDCILRAKKTYVNESTQTITRKLTVERSIQTETETISDTDTSFAFLTTAQIRMINELTKYMKNNRAQPTIFDLNNQLQNDSRAQMNNPDLRRVSNTINDLCRQKDNTINNRYSFSSNESSFSFAEAHRGVDFRRVNQIGVNIVPADFREQKTRTKKL